MSTVEKITRIPIQDAFRYEAKDFTPWLCENIEVIGDAIGVELINPEREQSTGNFSVDIKAETGYGGVVVIENQYGASNHDHLGKLITYLSSFNAELAIWIVENPKQEHVNAITWLNEGDNNCDFYLLRVEAIKIGESFPAPLLSLITGPSIESKQIGKIRKEGSENERLRKAYWDLLFEKTNDLKINQFTSITASGRDAWMGATAGLKGLTYVFWVNQHSTRIELRIDRGKGSEQENLDILNRIKESKLEVESAFGGELNWADLEGYRVCSIRLEIDEGGYKDEPEKWEPSVSRTVDSMYKLINSTKKVITSLKL